MKLAELYNFARAIKVSAAEVGSLSSLKKRVQPGDIMIVSTSASSMDPLKDPVGFGLDRTFGAVSRTLYGRDNAHAALVLDKNRVLDMRKKLEIVDLNTAAGPRDVKILRPELPAADRLEAARKAEAFHKAFGKKTEYADAKHMLKMLWNDKMDRRAFVSDADKGIPAHKVICSSLIANIYKDKADLAAEKPTGFTTPSDLIKSPAIKHTTTFKNPDRWDKGQSWTVR